MDGIGFWRESGACVQPEACAVLLFACCLSTSTIARSILPSIHPSIACEQLPPVPRTRVLGRGLSSVRSRWRTNSRQQRVGYSPICNYNRSEYRTSPMLLRNLPTSRTRGTRCVHLSRVCVWGYLTRLELVVVQCACEPSDSRALEADQQLAIHGTRHLQVRAVLLRSYPISLSLALPWQAHAHVLMIVESSISCG